MNKNAFAVFWWIKFIVKSPSKNNVKYNVNKLIQRI